MACMKRGGNTRRGGVWRTVGDVWRHGEAGNDGSSGRRKMERWRHEMMEKQVGWRWIGAQMGIGTRQLRRYSGKGPTLEMLGLAKKMEKWEESVAKRQDKLENRRRGGKNDESCRTTSSRVSQIIARIPHLLPSSLYNQMMPRDMTTALRQQQQLTTFPAATLRIPAAETKSGRSERHTL